MKQSTSELRRWHPQKLLASLLIVAFIVAIVGVLPLEPAEVASAQELADPGSETSLAAQATWSDPWPFQPTSSSFPEWIPAHAGQGNLTATLESSVTATRAPDGRWWGVQIYGQNLRVENMDKVGAGVVRVPLEWKTIEPANTTPANYQWPAEFEGQLAQLAARNIRIILTLMGNPSWAATYEAGPIDKTDVSELVQFMEAAVDRYSAPPYNIKFWEIYNEPDNARKSRAAHGGWGYFRRSTR